MDDEILRNAWPLADPPDLWPSIEEGLDDLHRAWAESARHPFVDLVRFPPEAAAIALVPGELARRRQTVPVRRDGDRLYVAIADPRDITTIDELRMETRLTIRALAADPSRIAAAIENAYPTPESILLAEIRQLRMEIQQLHTEMARLRQEVERPAHLLPPLADVLQRRSRS